MTYDAEVLVVGCGNVLFKDDGFGPTAIKELEEHLDERPLPDNVITIDGGTSAPYYVFSLPNPMWKKIIILDISDFGGKPGDVKILSKDDVPEGKYQDPHSLSVADPLDDLDEVEIVIIACQPEKVSSPFVEVGLSDSVKDAIPKAIDIVYEQVKL
ncbi:coenzyme F420-reducing hydrogenase, FrhD protein [Candidatus Methanosphaera massiliense]|uniref:coenzyme F420-reducing hydrogenase, FrhD protein n=1 Tax=Methanosphaera TaxID=2316 RepID=UPI000DC5E0DD|nr:coenzyme F420-reducing hydrogenase, FrhD protein [Candidatus Methanosphaera massiliense]MDE4077905.1 coenzyme F420-reducing hydrogenase, FrhD protein [Candidatus Methanosphaera massiliense]RAP44018.1 MAG: coenzyme F420-reducing hydrogenase, FrhD protein [Methanosphaera sp. SHI1033]